VKDNHKNYCHPSNKLVLTYNAKYVGRMLRRGESKSLATTSIDSLLVSLSAANTLHQRLSVDISLNPNQNDFLEQYASTMGVFCDACEKFDHLEVENVHTMLTESNNELFNFSMVIATNEGVDLEHAIASRRQFLRERAFFIED